MYESMPPSRPRTHREAHGALGYECVSHLFRQGHNRTRNLHQLTHRRADLHQKFQGGEPMPTPKDNLQGWVGSKTRCARAARGRTGRGRPPHRVALVCWHELDGFRKFYADRHFAEVRSPRHFSGSDRHLIFIEGQINNANQLARSRLDTKGTFHWTCCITGFTATPVKAADIPALAGGL